MCTLNKMENVLLNQQPLLRGKNKPRFSLQPGPRRPRQSLLSLGSNGSITSETSEDDNWDMIRKLTEKSHVNDDIDLDDIVDEDYARHIGDRRISMGTMGVMHQRLSLEAKNAELDEEIEYMEALIRSGEENFVDGLIQLTQERCAHELGSKLNIPITVTGQGFKAVEDVELSVADYTEWSLIIERAVEAEFFF